MDPNSDRYKVYAMDGGCDVIAPSGRLVASIPWSHDNPEETKRRAWDMVVVLNEMRYMQQIRETELVDELRELQSQLTTLREAL